MSSLSDFFFLVPTGSPLEYIRYSALGMWVWSWSSFAAYLCDWPKHSFSKGKGILAIFFIFIF
jgi:hypothetical protein